MIRRPSRSADTHAARFLRVQALDPDGLLVRDDGALVRYLRVLASNPLVVDDEGCERLTAGFTELLLRIPAGMNVQAYVQADPVSLEQLLEELRADTDAATDHLVTSTDDQQRAQGMALRRLAEVHEDGLAQHAQAQAALQVTFVLVVVLDPAEHRSAAGPLPGRPARREPDPLRRSAETHVRLARESWALTEELRGVLRTLDMPADPMTGPQVADLLWTRLAPATARTLPHQAPSRTLRLTPIDEHTSARDARRAAAALREAIAQAPVDTRPLSHVRVDGDLEQTVYVSRRPARTFYGWLLHAMQADRPWTLSVHVRMHDPARRRQALRRQERVLWGVNTGTTGRPDREQLAQQAEAAQVADELASGGQSIADVAIYQSLREPGPHPDPRSLAEAVTAAVRAMAAPVEAGVQAGDGQQPDLWQATLPLGLDPAGRSFPLITRNAADCLPFLSTSSGSPSGIPFAFADPGRTVERIDPFDRMHDNALTLIYARSGRGKTSTVIALASAAMCRGAQVSVIDRSNGHYRFLCSLIPGAAHLELGTETDPVAINPWDTPTPGAVPKAKIAYLLRLHALLIGDHHAGEDHYGLTALERSLLAHAIRETYRTAHTQGLLAREALLHQVLGDLADQTADSSPEHAAVYRTLALQVADLCHDGTYAYLFDRPTSVPAAEACPLVVFNTDRVPEDVSTAVLFSVFEHISARVDHRWDQHRTALADGRLPRGSMDGTSILVFEEVWKVLARRATAEYVTERARRGRHSGLWTIALTQARRDLDTPHAQALLDNATLHLLLGQSHDDLRTIGPAIGLTRQEHDLISHLITDKGHYAQAYLLNGDRGRGTLTLRPGPALYWLSTSEPHHDIPTREAALRQAGGDPWRALEVLGE